MIHNAILPIGAGHITNDIAIGLRTSIEVAEKIRLNMVLPWLQLFQNGKKLTSIN